MKSVFKSTWPYQGDAMNLPVENVDEAVQFYETVMGFQVASRNDSPHKSAVLARDEIKIGLAENGGDPTQEGCFFDVGNVAAAFAEIKGKPPADSDLRMDQHGDKSFKVFFVVAPDGLCYMIGEQIS